MAKKDFKTIQPLAKNPLYWEVKAHIHACGEAHARAGEAQARMQQAQQLVKATAEQFRYANAELAAVWKKTGLKGQPTDYHYDDATNTIVTTKPETKLADPADMPNPAPRVNP